jgi:Ni/Co efflux regulator RcnB
MKTSLKLRMAITLLVAGMVAGSPVFADRPEWAGNDNKGKHGKSDKESKNEKSRDDDRRDERRDDCRNDARDGGHFSDRHHTIVREYYSNSFRSGRCPPGLAKKNNGCQPPGQARKWSKGHPLPHDVVYYSLPQRVLIDLGAPPAGHKYVRVASDILLIAIGTGMVVDAIQDLGGL